MKFYVPEWDDYVDANYDFEHDEHSTLGTEERELHYIWDIFDYETTPIDGVLISREQVESNAAKAERLREHGIYGDQSRIDLPRWLPTISDCGAWGYKALPFPPYSNKEMLEFYEDLGVDIGVTIDHLVLGSGKEGRLYLDERAFEDVSFSQSTVIDELESEVDVMVDEWPDEWPEYVAEIEPEVYEQTGVVSFEASDLEGSPTDVIQRLEADPRAVYRDNDTEFRYRLTLDNAAAMRRLYDNGEYSFRLMVAIQGWDPQSYVEAAEDVLELDYDHIGIGGAAGSDAQDVRDIVTGVGNAVAEYQRNNETRVGTHVFGFAKTDVFETIGRSGVTSFDSASMLRSAWTGGDNYHLDGDRRYDAIRVRMGSNRESLEERIEKALRGQELLHALRAYDENRSIAEAIREWYYDASNALEQLEPYLQEHRHDGGNNHRLLQDVEAHFRSDFAHGSELRASFSKPFRRAIVKLLRDDDPTDPIPFEEYESLIATADDRFEPFPRKESTISQREQSHDSVAAFDHIWHLVEDYATWVGDENLLEEYRDILRDRPWEDCGCPICEEHGIEVAIFRGNNRNRRRGFHNTRRFYDILEKELPNLLVVTPAMASVTRYETVEAFLQAETPDLWRMNHDLPVAEIGTLTAGGVHEWWKPSPTTVSLDPTRMADTLEAVCVRYQDLYLYDPDDRMDRSVLDAVSESNCTVTTYEDPSQVRADVLDRLDYESEFLPEFRFQSGLTEF